MCESIKGPCSIAWLIKIAKRKWYGEFENQPNSVYVNT